MTVLLSEAMCDAKDIARMVERYRNSERAKAAREFFRPKGIV